jgi:hypothetical protein
VLDSRDNGSAGTLCRAGSLEKTACVDAKSCALASAPGRRERLARLVGCGD